MSWRCGQRRHPDPSPVWVTAPLSQHDGWKLFYCHEWHRHEIWRGSMSAGRFEPWPAERSCHIHSVRTYGPKQTPSHCWATVGIVDPTRNLHHMLGFTGGFSGDVC